MKPDYIIFTDGSAIRYKNEFVLGYGAVLFNVKTQRFATMGGSTSNRTIIYAEGRAIYEGIRALSKIVKHSANVVIVTDSEITLKVFSEYIPNKWNLKDPDNWKKSDGSSVKNQDLYKLIYRKIKKSGFNIKFVHIRSHKIKSDADMIQKHMKQNSVTISLESAEFCIKMNNIADELASKGSHDALAKQDGYIHLKWKS